MYSVNGKFDIHNDVKAGSGVPCKLRLFAIANTTEKNVVLAKEAMSETA